MKFLAAVNPVYINVVLSWLHGMQGMKDNIENIRTMGYSKGAHMFDQESMRDSRPNRSLQNCLKNPTPDHLDRPDQYSIECALHSA